LPDIRRAPVAPMMTPAANDVNQVNAFTPVAPRPTYVQTTNAFGSGMPGMPMGPAPASASPSPTFGSANMTTQALRPTGSTVANSSVKPASFQEGTLTSPTVPATYQTLSPAPPYPALTSAKPATEHLQPMVTALRDSLYPSQREWAAESLAAI